jgi:hypothetical protein
MSSKSVTSFLAGITALIQMTVPTAAATDSRVFEIRTYYVAPGKLEALHTRFRDHTVRLFEKHGMTQIGYWTPVENQENTRLIFVLAYPNREAREASWKAFVSDPEWQRAYEASHVNGPLVSKADSVFYTATDYSPAIKPSKDSKDRLFELRTYVASPGNLENLHARFRNHTVELFSKHGMEHIGYWAPMKDQPGAADTFLYLLAHPSREARDRAFQAFRDDPDWSAARKASEEKAGGSLTAQGGVKELFLVPTDYSPTR